jgi:hypothetical protein
MFFTPSETQGFQLVHTAKQYLEVVSNPNRVTLDNLLPQWDGETMDIDVQILPILLIVGSAKNHDGGVTARNCCE